MWTNLSLAALFCLALLAVSDASTAIDRLALYIIPLQIMVLSRVPTIFGRTVPGSAAEWPQPWSCIVPLIAFVWLNYAQHASQWLPYRNYFWA